MQQPNKLPRVGRIDRKKEIITTQKLVPFFEEIKELIKSTAKGTETVLRNEIRDFRTELKVDITFTQQALKATKEDLETKMGSMETHLSDKIDKIAVRVNNHETRITSLESTVRL